MHPKCYKSVITQAVSRARRLGLIELPRRTLTPNSTFLALWMHDNLAAAASLMMPHEPWAGGE